MVDIEAVRVALADRRASVVAERTGLSEPTVRAIRDGRAQNPRQSTLKLLVAYLSEGVL